MVDAATIKTRKDLRLKPNPYLKDPSIPYGYQTRQVLMMLLRPRQVVGDDVGIGKTLEAIVAFTYMKARDPRFRMMVFTEKGCLDQWYDEILWLTTGIKPRIITAETHPDSLQRARALSESGADVIITTYSTAYDYTPYLLKGMGEKWVFMADEPNYFKSTDSILHKNMYGMVNGSIEGKPYKVENQPDEKKKRCLVEKEIAGAYLPSRAYGLTATIIENRLDEAFGILRIVAPGTFPGRKYFEDNFCKMKKIPGRRGEKRVVGYKNLDQFRRMIEPVYYGRLQDDPEVEQDLPEVIYKDLNVTLGKEQGRKLIEATDRVFQTPTGEIKQVDVLPSLILAQKMASDPRLGGFDIIGAKTEALVEMLQNSLAGERVIIYSKFRSVVDLLQEEFKKRNIEAPVRITGTDSMEERNIAKRRFMSDNPAERANILLMTRAGQKGLNLQKGGLLIFYDLPWSYGAYRQTIGRLKRTGSTHASIMVMHLLARLSKEDIERTGIIQTIDHHTLNTVRKKFELWQAITGDIKEIDSVTEDWMDIFEAVKSTRKEDA